MENINLTEIKELIISTEKSKIYKSGLLTDTYNKIFDKNEKPTSCGSCLRTFFLKIKNWYQEEVKKQMEAEKETEVIVEVTPEPEPEVEIIPEEVIEASPDKVINDVPEEAKKKGRKKK